MKFLATAAMFLGLASISQAALINLDCAPNPLQINSSFGGGVETCDLSPLTGATINSVSAFLLFDFITTATSGASADFSFSGAAGLSYADTANLAARPQSTVIALDASNPLWSAGGSYVITESFTGTDNIQAGLFFKTITVDYEPNNGRVPEPGSLALMGSGLLGLGLMARRRRARK